MTKKSELGQLGEDFAAEYLKKQGYKILERNFRQPWGEIDIIAKAPDKTLVFAEVKTMFYPENKENIFKKEWQNIQPEDQITGIKIKTMKKTASLYAGANQGLIYEKSGWRIDLIAVSVKNSDFEIRHYKNICL